MKKVLRKFIVIVCVATLCIMPSTTALASTTSQPVLTYDAYGMKMFTYQPDPLDVYAGQTVYFLDNGSEWQVPAGKSFGFYMGSFSGTYRIQVFRGGSGIVTDMQISGSRYFVYPVESSSTYYFAFITAITDTEVVNYYVVVN